MTRIRQPYEILLRSKGLAFISQGQPADEQMTRPKGVNNANAVSELHEASE